MPDTALVAGAGGGLGPAVVQALRADGWSVVATSRSGAEVEGAQVIAADVAGAEDARRAVAAAGELGAVVNLVGGFSSGPLLHEVAEATLRELLEAHLVTTFNLVQAAAPALLERGGAFVAVSARAAERPFPGGAAYSTAKAAVLALVRGLDADLGPQGLRANVLLPGVIDTPANREAMPSSDRKGWTAPADIAEVVRFLVSADARAVRGAALPV
jgi:NAD(P)-dependent dehydrogenase (short-subunit alcohol dehydrogenase family)